VQFGTRQSVFSIATGPVVIFFKKRTRLTEMPAGFFVSTITDKKVIR